MHPIKTKKIIITVGMSAVGKSTYAQWWIENNPEYILIGADFDLEKIFDKISNHEFVIMDYYFAVDYNANQMRATLKCDVEIIVLFDSPEAISYRQINHRPLSGINYVDCYHAKEIYADGALRTLINLHECKFINASFVDGYSIGYTFENYTETQYKYWKPYSENMILKELERIKNIPSNEYDCEYHHFNLPYGHRIGRDGYARNELTWEIIKNWIDWRNKKILDLCCFHAYFCQQIWFAGGEPVGCDIHNHAIYTACVFAKINQTRFRLFHCDIDHEFPEGDFDVAMLFNVFHHLKNQDCVLSRMQNYPVCLFEINAKDKEKIEQYFDIDHEEKSPKDGRILLKTRSKSS